MLDMKLIGCFAGFMKSLYLCIEIALLTLSDVVQAQIINVMAYKINEDCTACGTCIDECPVEAISEGDIYKIDPEVCTDCGACADVCPVEAIHPE
jgi:ferredoxin